MKKLFIFLILLIQASVTQGQVPATEVYLVNIRYTKGKTVYDKPVNISNNPGYDNQPSFSDNGNKILYVSVKDSIQSDIYEYDLTTRKTKQLTSTPESEYSPRYTMDEKFISVVRVDKDSSQRFYKFSGQGQSERLSSRQMDSVAYYTWLSSDIAALAILNNGMDLYIFNTADSNLFKVINGIGRCLISMPDSFQLIYTKKEKQGTELFRYDPIKNNTSLLCKGFKMNQDYAMGKDGTLYTGYDGKLFSIRPGVSDEWMELADFKKEVGNFYRLTISPDGTKMAIVSYPGELP
jgi:Tol biopolymer transport system component